MALTVGRLKFPVTQRRMKQLCRAGGHPAQLLVRRQGKPVLHKGEEDNLKGALNLWYEICIIFRITKEGYKMKKLRYIIPVILVIASSCTSQLYTGTTDDDLYYRPSDQPVVAVQTTTPAGTTDQYYDNMLAGDTLIADDYVPSDAYLSGTGADAAVVNNYYGGSAAERIYLFNDGFYPYWDYYSPFSLGMSYGYGFGSSFGWGYPYYGYGYGRYNPYYGYGYGGYNPYYGYGFGSYYDPYWGYGGGYPYYGYGGYSPYYGNNYPPYYNDGSSRQMARRGSYSTSTRGSYTTEGDGRIKSGIPTQSGYSRRTGSASPAASSAQTGTSTPTRRPAGVTEKSSYNRSSSVPNSGLTNGQGYTRRDPQTQSVNRPQSVSYTHLRAHETRHDLV